MQQDGQTPWPKNTAIVFNWPITMEVFFMQVAVYVVLGLADGYGQVLTKIKRYNWQAARNSFPLRLFLLLTIQPVGHFFFYRGFGC
jgi:hypothetical protein